jgi:hypothetical protein
VAEEIIEARSDEDLWDVFTLEEVAEGEAADIEAVLDEEVGEPFNEDETVEEFTFPEEDAITPLDAVPETAGVPTLVTADLFDHIGEESSITGEEIPVAEPDTGGVFEIEAEPAAQMTFVSGLDEAFPTTAPGVPEVELQFAPEEKYVPVIPTVEAAPPPVPPAAPVALSPAVHVESSLSEEQLASLVEKISRDIIEKIAWEVVPDLAETLIREEIRKLKEGLRE